MTPYVTVALTSLVAYLIAVKCLGRRSSALPAALGRLADFVGTGMVFAAVNLLVAAGVILAVRGVTDRFVTLYSLDDVVWLVVSLLQGSLWRLWRDATVPAA
jgi:hypothetical protein